MSFLSSMLNVFGIVFLAHSVYSSYEHSLSLVTTAKVDPALAKLPLDIVIELLFSVALLSTGIVLASPALRPIQWSVWADQVERDDRRPKDDRLFGEEGQLVVNPFRWLEERKGFVDIRAQRKEFADWIRNGAGVEK